VKSVNVRGKSKVVDDSPAVIARETKKRGNREGREMEARYVSTTGGFTT